MANNDLLTNRLKELNKSKEVLKQEKPNVVQNIATGADLKEEKPDFMKMAEVLEAQKGEKKSLLEGAVKDTIYIREDLFKAMNAICIKQGDKRKHVNAAYELYLSKIYNEKKNELNIDK